MKQIKTLIVLLLACAIAVPVFAASTKRSHSYSREDESIAIYVQVGGSEVCVINIHSGGAGSTNSVLIGSVETTIDGSGGTDTIGEFAAAIAAATNSAGVKVLTVTTHSSASNSESTDDELLDGKTTIQPGKSGGPKWDTSDVSHFSTFIPGTAFINRGSVLLEKIYGNIGGTGDITVNVYFDQTEVYETVIRSPIYLHSATGTTETFAADEVGPGQLGHPLGGILVNMELPAGKNILIKATRASSGTTGSIGATTIAQ